MGLFRQRRAAAGTLGLDRELGRIIAYGQFQMDPGSVEPGTFGNLEADLYPLARDDPDGFTRQLAELVIPVGGTASYGGARLSGSLLGWNFHGVHYLRMLDAALEWRHATGASAVQLAPYEMARWAKLHGPWNSVP